jgi:hypothetical protein
MRPYFVGNIIRLTNVAFCFMLKGQKLINSINLVVNYLL